MGKRHSGSTIRIKGKAAHAFVLALSASMRRCRFCGCHEMAACPGGCSWTGAELCSACTPSAEETETALLLVGGTEHITSEAIGAWSNDQRADAFAWAMAVHYRASDNDVEVPPRPTHTMSEVSHG